MSRGVASVAGATILAGLAAVIGGKAGLIAGPLAVGVLVAGTALEIPALVTAAGAVLAAGYAARLLVDGGRLDLQAPLVGVLLVAGLELGHLALEGGRYRLAGGPPVLGARAAATLSVVVAGFGVAWLVLWAPLWSGLLVERSPGAGAAAAGALAAAAIFAVLIALGWTVGSAPADEGRPPG